jgi:glycosyltransferase involved in cell wall biosynthesis
MCRSRSPAPVGADEMREAGCRVPIVAIRHVPASPRGAVDPAQRNRIRAQWNVAPSTLLVGAVGAFKPQKDFPRAVEILAALRGDRDAELVILGGVLDDRQLAELERTLQRTAELGLGGRVKLPGFVDAIGPYYAACDVLLQPAASRGSPWPRARRSPAGCRSSAMDVGGQSEIAHERLELLPPAASAAEVARCLDGTHRARRCAPTRPCARRGPGALRMRGAPRASQPWTRCS